ncbi:hypothetical protein STEG23_004977 [Scotinomys teguina]
MDITTDPRCSSTMNLDMALRSSPDSTTAPVAAQASQINMAPAVAWPLGIQRALRGNWGHGHHSQTPALGKAMDLDMALGSSSCQDVSLAPGGSTSHPDQHGPRHGTVLRD